MLFSVSRSRARRASVLTSVIALATAVSGVLVSPTEASERVTPGNFTGYGFDQCVTPSQETMDAWLNTSPYWAVGVYIAGENRYCGDAMQTNLTPEWVSTQLSKGWRVLPITVGPQAPCYVNPQKKVRIDNDPDRNYAGARAQGRIEARETVRRARALGIAARSTLWYDIEAYDISNDVCRTSTLSFLSAWTRTLHNLDYVSGVYSSASTGIRALDDARVLTPRRYTMPDQVWVAEWVHETAYRSPPRTSPPSLLSAYLRDDGWLPGGRMRQYRGGHSESHGGVTINIDTNYLDLGRGTRAGRAPRFCRGQRVDFPRYRRLHFGNKGGQVRALQCFLKRRNLYSGKLTYFYNHRTVRGVTRFQRRQGLRENGRMWWSTWTVMLAQGRTPVLKVGSGGRGVRRLQRTLNAATRSGIPVDGIFGADTTQVVREYQGEVGLPRTGVVDPDTWAKLKSGRL
jgi:hypothetical protein